MPLLEHDIGRVSAALCPLVLALLVASCGAGSRAGLGSVEASDTEDTSRARRPRWGRGIGLGGKDVRKDLVWIEDRGVREGAQHRGPGDYGRRLEFDGVRRFYEIHVPRGYDQSSPYPVVLNFHGGGGYPAGAAYQTGMDDLADREGFIVVYPAGTGTLFKDRLLVWNDGRRYENGKGPKADDVGFVAVLLDDLARLFHVDPTRVYVCGISNGAQFAYRVAKQLSERIAAVAAVAGPRPATGIFPPPSRPMSIMQFAGRADEYSPYEGGVPSEGKGLFKNRFRTRVEPVENVIRSWVEFNHCPSQPAAVKRVGKAVRTQYGPCRAGSEVVLWTLEDGGHTWPGGQVFPAEIKAGVGKVNRDIVATELMWAFFKKHRREEPRDPHGR